jgi:hypothetical protein
MAYSIKFTNPSMTDSQLTQFRAELKAKLEADGRFKVPGEIREIRAQFGRGKARVSNWVLEMKYVRLNKAKEYCGQHPGECQIGPFGAREKRKSSCLEWNDWIEFNALVNDVLDAFGQPAEVWSVPMELMDKGKKFFIRLDNKRRVEYDWHERAMSYGRVARVWDHGSPSQFQVTP